MRVRVAEVRVGRVTTPGVTDGRVAPRDVNDDCLTPAWADCRSPAFACTERLVGDATDDGCVAWATRVPSVAAGTGRIGAGVPAALVAAALAVRAFPGLVDCGVPEPVGGTGVPIDEREGCRAVSVEDGDCRLKTIPKTRRRSRNGTAMNKRRDNSGRTAETAPVVAAVTVVSVCSVTNPG